MINNLNDFLWKLVGWPSRMYLFRFRRRFEDRYDQPASAADEDARRERAGAAKGRREGCVAPAKAGCALTGVPAPRRPVFRRPRIALPARAMVPSTRLATVTQFPTRRHYRHRCRFNFDYCYMNVSVSCFDCANIEMRGSANFASHTTINNK